MKPPLHSIAITLIILSFSILPLPAKDKDGAKDFPGIKRFKGSEITAYSARDFDKYYSWINTAEKSADAADPKIERIEGAVTRIGYQIPPGPGSLEILRNYENHLKEAGFQIVASQSEPANYKTSNILEKNRGSECLTTGYETEIAYLGAKKTKDGVTWVVNAMIWVRSDTRNAFVQLDVVQIGEVKNKMTLAEELATEIAASGKVNVYGINFDSGKTDIKADSDPVLKEVALLLKNDASLKLQVIGHTDNVGGEEFNDKLSLGRATAVVKNLVDRGIGKARLIPLGKGLSQPVADNATEEGRARNRRVELVKI